jgi:hypothetical protein
MLWILVSPPTSICIATTRLQNSILLDTRVLDLEIVEHGEVGDVF